MANFPFSLVFLPHQPRSFLHVISGLFRHHDNRTSVKKDYSVRGILGAKLVWFSVKERKWKVGFFGKFSWTGKMEIFDSDNCMVSLARSGRDGRLIAIVRRTKLQYSRFMKKQIQIRYMLGFEIKAKPSEPRSEVYAARQNNPKKSERPKSRWVLKLSDDHWIWDWSKDEDDISASRIYEFYQEIVNEIDNPTLKSDNIFDLQIETHADLIIPVIYQPRVDTLKNFVREVHVAKGDTLPDGSHEVEVSVLYNNERLRNHGILNSLYEPFRRVLHGRVMDLETFKILVKDSPPKNRFTFKGIYSDKYAMNADSIHGDKEGPPPERPIKYYFASHQHPVVFVNTSNHAMAEHDTNHRIWKVEYVPWLEDAPVKLGKKRRDQIDKRFK